MPRLKRLFALLVPVFFWSSTSFGGAREGGHLLGGERTWQVVCELALSAPNRKSAESRLEKEVFNRPYVSYVVHHMTDLGFAKLGLKLDLQKIKNLVFVANSTGKDKVTAELHLYADGNFNKIYSYEFTNPVLSGLQSIELSEDQDDLSYEELVKRASSRRKDWVSYQSAPDSNGIRYYVSFSEGSGMDISEHASFGLDIPCDDVTKYTTDVVEVVDDLRSPDGKRCRVAVLSFVRME